MPRHDGNTPNRNRKHNRGHRMKRKTKAQRRQKASAR